MDWNTITKVYIECNSLTDERAESFKKFINGKVAEDLHTKGCDVGYIGYLILMYGYGHEFIIDITDVKKEKRTSRLIDSHAVNYFMGEGIRDKWIEGLERMKTTGEGKTGFTGHKSPVMASFHFRSKKKGAPQKWQIKNFIILVDQHLREASRGRSDHNLILCILDYFPPWKEGRRADYQGSDSVETDANLKRLKKHLKNRPDDAEQLCDCIKGSYESWKIFWELPEEIRNGDVGILLEELKKKEEGRIAQRVHNKNKKKKLAVKGLTWEKKG